MTQEEKLKQAVLEMVFEYTSIVIDVAKDKDKFEHFLKTHITNQTAVSLESQFLYDPAVRLAAAITALFRPECDACPISEQDTYTLAKNIVHDLYKRGRLTGTYRDAIGSNSGAIYGVAWVIRKFFQLHDPSCPLPDAEPDRDAVEQ